MNDHRPIVITLIVVGTIALVALLYAGTLSYCAIASIAPPESLLSNLKDVGLVALGALSALLARTGTPNPEPTQVTTAPGEALNVAAIPGKPVETQETTSDDK